MRIIPAIDVIGGQCVRLTQGDYAQSRVYDSDPVALARQFEDQGFRYLHMVDLDGARQGQVVHLDLLERMASATSLQIDFGGGIKSTMDARRVLDAGAVQFTAGSIAIKEPETVAAWLEEFGADRVILGADSREGRISVSGWQEQTEQELVPFIKAYQEKGMRYVLCTEISRDGMLQGPALELYAEILEQTASAEGLTSQRLYLIASGGVHELNDILQLKAMGCEAVVVGKALLEGRLPLPELIALSD